MNPLIWINDDEPALGADVSLDQCLAEARLAGYDGIEMGHRFPTTAPELASLLAHHGLALVSGWYGARLIERGVARELELLAPRIDLLCAMGCGTIVLGEMTHAVHLDDVPASARPVLARDALARFAGELERLAERVQQRGIRLALHHHVGTVIESPEDVDHVLAETSSLGLVLDTGHLAWGAAGPIALDRFVERHAARIVHVHLKDVRPLVLERVLRDQLSFLDAVRAGVFTVPGDGALALDSVVRVLARHRYQGWIVVEAEQDPARAHPLTYARLGYAGASRMIAACAETLPDAA